MLQDRACAFERLRAARDSLRAEPDTANAEMDKLRLMIWRLLRSQAELVRLSAKSPLAMRHPLCAAALAGAEPVPRGRPQRGRFQYCRAQNPADQVRLQRSPVRRLRRRR
jgi:hypothetical protein